MAPNTTRRAGNSRRPRRLGPYHAPTLVSSFVAPGRGRTALPGHPTHNIEGSAPTRRRKSSCWRVLPDDPRALVLLRQKGFGSFKQCCWWQFRQNARRVDVQVYKFFPMSGLPHFVIALLASSTELGWLQARCWHLNARSAAASTASCATRPQPPALPAARWCSLAIESSESSWV